MVARSSSKAGIPSSINNLLIISLKQAFKASCTSTGIAFGNKQQTITNNPHMVTVLYLLTAIICFALFFKSIEWFDKL